MIKTLQTTLKQDKERFKVPRSVQDIIPIRRLWPDGIFQFGSKYSKTMRFSDINYAIASKEDKTAMFLSYSELLNALDTGSTTKITINNKRINRHNFEQEILIPPQGDFLDGGRAEYNAILLDKVTDSSNSVVQERYITLSAHKKNIEEARTFFDRTMGDAVSRLNHMDSRCEELDSVERLRILHDFYRVGEETQFRLDLADCMKNGRFFKDAICPDSMEFKKDHFVMGNKYGRVLFLKEYASYIKDSMINELTSLNRSLMLSIDIIPVPTDEAVREMQNRLLGVETNVTNWQRRQNANNNFSAVVPYDLEQQRKETREMLDDLTTRDQRMMFAVVTLVHLADSKKELDSDTETLQSIARKHLCQLTTLNWQQADGLVTALPLGLRRIDALRTLTTEALAVLMPFKAQEIWDRGGVYYGQNAISKNLIVADRRQLLNGNAFILGVSGSGKSFSAKKEMVSLALSTQDDIIVIDPESEYRPLIEGLGGQVINISATSPNHINAMDMEQGYALIVASSISDKSRRDSWSGIIFEGNTGTVYGNPTIQENMEIPSGKTLTVPENTTLTVKDGVTLTNNGTITGNGTLDGEGNLVGSGTVANIIRNNLQKDSNVTVEVSSSPATYGSKVDIRATISKATNAITLAAENQNQVEFFVGTDSNKKSLGTAKVRGDAATLSDVEISQEKGFAVGENTITAEYGGSMGLKPQTGSTRLTVQGDLKDAIVTVNGEYFYTNSPITPEVSVTWNGTRLTKDADYTLAYTNHTNAGKATVTVTGTGNYTGTKTESFTIGKAKQAALSITGKPSTPIIYGQEFTLSADGGSGRGAVTWAVTSNPAYATVDNTGKVQITGVGAVAITATKAEDANYKETAATYDFTTQKAIPLVGTVSKTSPETIYPTTALADIRILYGSHIFHKTAPKHEAVPSMVRIPNNQQTLES